MSNEEKWKIISRQYNFFHMHCEEVQGKEFEIWEDTGDDPPDVCVGNYDIGIEFKNFYHKSEEKGGSQIKANESNQERTVHRACELYENSFDQPQPLNVSFHWNKAPDIRQIEEFAQAICDLIGKHAPFDSKRSLKWEDFRGTILSGCLDSINIYVYVGN
ncbi:MAG: hypothetical protein ACOCXZ_00730, partial [Chloroflexota bacterium]